jgi:dihydrofolate synthase/folylpolyglutamate synthase
MSRVSYNHTTFNLSRMNRLLGSIGNPHKKLKCVHIAGTKGKGSTAVMISGMLRANGLKVGLYTSPHVQSIRERICVNDSWISEADFVRCVNAVLPFVRGAKGTKPTFFELITAMGFLYFAEQGVDIAVIETGLGGRLDATNVLRPEVCAITSISLDHTAQLGNSLELIAEEKAGIFKAGIPAISAPQPEGVKSVLRRIAERQGAPLQFTGDEIEFSYRFESSRLAGPHGRVCLSTPTSYFEHLSVPLPGEHQAINCGVALSVIDALKSRGFALDDQKAVEGLADARLPGRMEIIHEEPKVLVDGAHNAASIEALMRTIGQSVSYDSMIVIFGCQTGKDIPGMIRHIQLGADKIIFTRSTAPNAAEPQVLAAVYQEQSGSIAQTCNSLEEAMRIAQRAVSSEDLICITGSFYLVGEAKRLLTN